MARRQLERAIEPMRVTFGKPFGYTDLPSIREQLHRFDRTNVTEQVVGALHSTDAAAEYRVRQLIEEAISSSLIEGARPTTRELARAIVREGRPPTTKDERMIVNNWHAMGRVLELVEEDRPLELVDLLELHRILGENALDVDGAEGRLREPSHHVDVADADGNVWHVPPPAERIEERLRSLLAFCEGASGPFLHPVLRAIIAHFWLAFEHPFRDGNGRIARALFYWCMLRHGYEMAEFLSISGPIDRKPSAYHLAFAYTETDDFDLTYFLLHQLGVLRQAMSELLDHLEQRAERTRQLASLVRDFGELNHRQRALLNHALRHPSETYTIQGHAASHQVHYLTARSDLAGLTERDLLVDHGGKPKRFGLSPSFATRLGTT